MHDWLGKSALQACKDTKHTPLIPHHMSVQEDDERVQGFGPKVDDNEEEDDDVDGSMMMMVVAVVVVVIT